MKKWQFEDGIINVYGIYVVFYSAVAIFSGYLNLYLDSVGLSEPQIGAIASISTICTFFAQLVWGSIADKVNNKVRLMQFMMLVASLVSLLFYANTSFVYLAVLVSLFSVFFNPITPIQDALTLEMLEGKKTDYGHVRTGGTIGYSFTALIVGSALQDRYRHIFWMVGIALLLCWILSFGYPKLTVIQEQVKIKTPKGLFKNKLLIGLVIFNFIFSIGMSFYYTFYPIYFVSIGGTSALVGTLMFVAAMTEVPMLFICRKLTNKIGIKNLLVIASLATMLRWFLLSIVVNPTLVIFVGVLHGVGYTSFSYSLVTYINDALPRHMRARGQSLNVLVGQVLPRVVFGYLGGLATSHFGIQRVLQANAILLGVAMLGFVWLVGSKHDKKQTI